MVWMRPPARPAAAPPVTLRPNVTSTWLHAPTATAAAAACSAITGLAPPCGMTAEKRRSSMPKFSMKSSAVPLTMPTGITPSMSRGDSPASAIASSDDSTCSSNAVWVEPRR